VLNHLGPPLGVGRYAGKRDERFGTWRDKIRSLGACENVAVKLGGLAMPWVGFPSLKERPTVTSAQLADEWRPYIETGIEAFGTDRCMFESNFPVDGRSCSYDLLWNAFKVITASYSADEKTALYRGGGSILSPRSR
jgi:L-fuconolactonase